MFFFPFLNWMLFSHVKLVKKPRLNWKSIDCNCEQYINVGNPFLPIAIFSTLACVIALCSIPHSKSDWYSLIPANYCHFVRVHVAAAGSFFSDSAHHKFHANPLYRWCNFSSYSVFFFLLLSNVWYFHTEQLLYGYAV